MVIFGATFLPQKRINVDGQKEEFYGKKKNRDIFPLIFRFVQRIESSKARHHQKWFIQQKMDPTDIYIDI